MHKNHLDISHLILQEHNAQQITQSTKKKTLKPFTNTKIKNWSLCIHQWLTQHVKMKRSKRNSYLHKEKCKKLKVKQLLVTPSFVKFHHYTMSDNDDKTKRICTHPTFLSLLCVSGPSRHESLKKVKAHMHILQP